LAGELQIAEKDCGSISPTEAHEVICFPPQQTWEDQSMRNVAFSILMFALAVVQIAVVSSELPKSQVQTAAVRNTESGTRVVVASNETEQKTPAF
jgi:hypothetical protein